MITVSWWQSSCAKWASRRWASCSSQSAAIRRQPWPRLRTICNRSIRKPSCWCCRPITSSRTLLPSVKRSSARRAWSRPASWPRSASCRRRRKPATATFAVVSRWLIAAIATTWRASSKSRMPPPPKASLPKARITGTAACSCSAPRATCKNCKSTRRPSPLPPTRPCTLPTATSISAVSTKLPSRHARPIRSTTRSWSTRVTRQSCRPTSAGMTSVRGRPCGKPSRKIPTAMPSAATCIWMA